jgi:hypothetical protein
MMSSRPDSLRVRMAARPIFAFYLLQWLCLHIQLVFKGSQSPECSADSIDRLFYTRLPFRSNSISVNSL